MTQKWKKLFPEKLIILFKLKYSWFLSQDISTEKQMQTAQQLCRTSFLRSVRINPKANKGGRIVCLDLLPTFWWDCLFVFFWYWAVGGVYKFEINPLSVDLFAKTFSHSVGCLLVVFSVSFAVKKLFSLIKSHLFVFLLSLL